MHGIGLPGEGLQEGLIRREGMTTPQNDLFIRNSEFSTEFSKYILEHPEMDDLLREDTVIVFYRSSIQN